MTNWYVGSVQHAAIAVFAVDTVYSVGNIVRRITPTAAAEMAFRCTTAGTSGGSEPTWQLPNNTTTTTGTAIFTNVTSQEAYGWNAAAGDISTLDRTSSPRLALGDTVFVASNSATVEQNSFLGGVDVGITPIRLLSVNPAGAVPPVAADLQIGAAVTNISGSLTMPGYTNSYFEGFVFTPVGSISFGSLSNTAGIIHLKNSQIILTGSSYVQFDYAVGLILDNTTIVMNGTATRILDFTAGTGDVTWLNTPNALSGSATNAITLLLGNYTGANFKAIGCDFSWLDSASDILVNGDDSVLRAVFIGCRIDPDIIRHTTTALDGTMSSLEFINCYDGTNTLYERANYTGNTTTERTIVLTGGAQDDEGQFSRKFVANANAQKIGSMLDGFQMSVANTVISSPKTARVEIISSTTLKDDEVVLEVWYRGTASSGVESFVSSAPATVLTTPANIPTSSATWDSSPSTPVKQYLSVTFTPQTAGLIRGLVTLRKASTTVYVNPVLNIT